MIDNGFGKNWWEKKHRENNQRWLTGSKAGRYSHFFGLDFTGARILEIGCGTLEATKQLAGLAEDLWVVDVSDLAVERANKIGGCKAIGLEDIVEYLPCGYFDIIVAYLVAQHLQDEDFSYQISYALNALNKDGDYAIQYLTLGQEDKRHQINVGTVSRSPSYLKKMVEEQGGIIKRHVEPSVFKNVIVGGHTAIWNGVIIGRGDA